jgi:malate dehydrogenase (oxaloacetate-decarboxylating)(NADP+)
VAAALDLSKRGCGSIVYNLLKTETGSNATLGPFLPGANASANILTSSSTVRRIINMAALTVIEANRVEST